MRLQTYLLSDLPKLSPHHFRWDNSCRTVGYELGANWKRGNTIRCNFPVVGICGQLSSEMMMSRLSPQIGILFQASSTVQFWQHFPVSLEWENQIVVLCQLVEDSVFHDSV